MTAHSTGLELILNAAEGVLQIAVTDNERLLCAQEWRRAERATEILAPALRDICAALDVRLADFRRIACVRGPGSFTGIRLVLSTAAALRRAGRARLAGLDYLQALATSAALRRGLLYGAPLWVLTHARRNQVHCQAFVSYGPLIPAQPLTAVELCPPDEALRRIAERPGHVCGSGLARNPAVFAPARTGSGPAGAEEARVMPELTSPDMAALCLLARHGDYFSRDLEPAYVRSCDAADNLPQLAERQGMDGGEAVSALDALLARAPKSEI
ncbi:tRNA (adenosine(37)-N6)-threonylcarbamoyltransferase complex dimerization subunit type 1 TsaB [Desulfovibrio sp. SGI.169]|uniref:tRNA (adenosine(37)-N6)-threonylcarbamoyltransferase complex dimerization subunit type 1 TsaB n=1 Tax=Desulfovibrio sp. SGI.169 TaxID=3420561 RepID=UPI003CFF43D9